MDYLPLQKYGYRFPDKLSQEILMRKNSPSAVPLSFDQGQYFYLITPTLLSLSEEIYTNEHQIIPELVKTLPERTYRWLLRSLYASEIQATHTIEGIHSTRKEAETAVAEATPHNKRFSEFFQVLKLVVTDGKNAHFTTIDSIRRLYDNVTDGEVNEENALDGEIFRREIVQIFSNSQKPLHTGFQPESKIIEGLNDMLTEAAHPRVSRLISAALCHFMFETVHPFYDGNGRTGRVLLAYHLSHDLQAATLLSLSQAISADKKTYYSCLQEARDSRNHGELTHFILTMLEFIVAAQNHVISTLQLIGQQLHTLDTKPPHIHIDGTQTQKHLAHSVISVVAQHYVFSNVLGISLDTLLEEIDGRVSRRSLAAVCDTLVEEGVLHETKRRPRMFTLSEHGAQLLNIEPINY